MKLEPIIQSEVSQKEKHQYTILTHIYGIQKDGRPYMQHSKRDTDVKKQTFGLCARGQGWDNMTEEH